MTIPLHMQVGRRMSPIPRHHRDPFDRLLVAQASAYDVPLATADMAVQAYGIRTLVP